MKTDYEKAQKRAISLGVKDAFKRGLDPVINPRLFSCSVNAYVRSYMATRCGEEAVK